jgi:demethylmenaquinone methyltransferase/2-methoxy-6-polyprenyl-1,4-benzoquinol methylase
MKEFLSRIKPEEFRRWNEEMVKKYDPDAFHHHPNPVVRFIEGKRVKTILALMNDNKEQRILEVGCGAGNILEKAPGDKLFGVDISAFILSKAKQKLNEKVSLFQADAQNLPFKDQTFKQIICSEVFEHLLDPSVSLKEIARILDYQGIAVVSIPNERWINRIKRILIRFGVFDWLLHRGEGYERMPRKMEEEWHLHALPLNKWLNLFKKSFRVTHLRRIPFVWLPLRYVIRLER